MKTFKIKSKRVVLSCLLISFYIANNAQDYYATPPPPPPPGYNQTNQSENNFGPSGYISINFGFATPEGGFANAVGSAYGGYALPGDIFHLSLGIPINHSNFGVAFMLGNYNNEYDLNTYANNNSEYAIHPDQNYYSETSIMGGFYATVTVGRLSFDGRLMAGMLINNLPEQDYGYSDAEGDMFEYDLQSSNSTSLALDAGGGLRYDIAEFWRRKLCFMVNLDYLYSRVSYSTEQNVYEVPVTGPNAGYQVQLLPSPTFSGTFPLQLLNLTFGLGYQI